MVALRATSITWGGTDLQCEWSLATDALGASFLKLKFHHSGDMSRAMESVYSVVMANTDIRVWSNPGQGGQFLVEFLHI